MAQVVVEWASLGMLKSLVLLGGGHSHLAVLKGVGVAPLPQGVRLTLISKSVVTPYSGMLPGMIAGHYSPDASHIELPALARFAGARTVFDEAVGLDLERRQVLLRDLPPIAYDVLSIDIGSTPNVTVPGAADYAVPVKPIDHLVRRWASVLERLRAGTAKQSVAVVGGGAAGVEIILAVQFRMRALLAREGAHAMSLEYHLFTDSTEVLPTYNSSVRRIFERVLRERRVTVHAGKAVTEVAPGRLRTADGVWHDASEVLWSTEAAAAPWLARSGLAVDRAGFVSVSNTLQSLSHLDVFAAGDIASMVGYPRERSGALAVHQGPWLAGNLRSALQGEPLTPHRPRRQFLSLISTGDRYAVASYGPLACEGRWVWRWKDRIDRRFMRGYTGLPVKA